jgi:hypothetical protein
MNKTSVSQYPISDFMEWEASKQLQIAPKFQRRDVWSPKAKSYLIDTVLRGLPIPPLFIRLKTDPTQRKTVREVVDGQQRLIAVLSFIKGDFAILGVHNEEFAGMTYAELPTETQKSFLGYKFLVNLLENVSDAEVLGVFARLNTYTVKLNSQELRNAKYFGACKQLAYELAHEHNTFWLNNGILRDNQISRMQDAEQVSILLLTILEGMKQTKSRDLDDFYEKYDDRLPGMSKIRGQFKETIDLIGELLGDELKSTEFHRLPLFYTLFIGLYDSCYGIPDSGFKRALVTQSRIPIVRRRLLDLSNSIGSESPKREMKSFVEASKYSTADVGKRILRHRVIRREVFDKR